MECSGSNLKIDYWIICSAVNESNLEILPLTNPSTVEI